MAQHRMNCRRSGVRPTAETDASEPPAVPRGVSVEEGFVPDVDQLPKPAGFGTEASTSSTSFQLLDTYTVPGGSLAKLGEASLSIASNGEAKIGVAGTEFGPFTGAVDITVGLAPSTLTKGYQVKVFHRSTDGASTTTRALVSVGEV